MDFTATTGVDGGSYEKPKPGTYTGVLIGFADIGTQEGGEFGPKRKVMLRWELHRRKGPSVDKDGHIHTQTNMYNVTLGAKALLRKVIEAHIGPIQDGDTFSSRDWLGKAAKLVLVETTDKKYINVQSVTPLDPEEDDVPERMEPLQHWEIGDEAPPPNWSNYMLERSQEWKARSPSAARKPVGAGVGAGDDDDEKIPY